MKDRQEEFEDAKRSNQGSYTDEKHTRRVKDTKGVLMGSTPKKDIQEEFEDAKEIIRRRISKDRQEGFEDT